MSAQSENQPNSWWDNIVFRFEEAWQRQDNPDLCAFLGVDPNASLIAELIHVDLERRLEKGQTVSVDDYLRRFPKLSERLELVRSLREAHARLSRPPSPQGDEQPPEQAKTRSADRNLLFGILALQMDFINRDQLVAGMHAWVLEKSKELGSVLVRQGALSRSNFELLAPLVEAHIHQHDNSPRKSLAAVSSLGSAWHDIALIPDQDVQASVARVASKSAKSASGNRTEAFPGREEGPSAGRFRILRPHAEGGLGRVSVAMDAELRREVALKEIKAKFADQPQSRARFLLEAEITGGLEHPGIVPVYGLGNYSDGRPFYAMRFIHGDSLLDAIEKYHAKRPGADESAKSVEFRDLLRRFLDVCNALQYAHDRGVLHRDLKPGNIMLGKYGETLIVDWGLAKTGVKNRKPGAGSQDTASREEPTLTPSAGSGSAETLAGYAMGTPGYMSPEQAEGRIIDLGPASDVYSLGATLYCLLTNCAPFEGTDIKAMLSIMQRGVILPPRTLKPNVSPALEAICLKAMAREIGNRYSTPRELADDIECWLANEPVAAWPEPISVKARRWIGKHRAFVTSASAAALVAAASLTVGIVWTEKTRADAAEAKTRNMELNEELRVAKLVENELRYQNLLEEVRERRARKIAGWTWQNNASIREAATLKSSNGNKTDLRTELVSTFCDFDLQLHHSLTLANAGPMAYHPQKPWLAVGQRNPTLGFGNADLLVIDLEKKEVHIKLAFPPVPGSGVWSIDFSADGRLLIAGSRGGKLLVWNCDNLELPPKQIATKFTKLERLLAGRVADEIIVTGNVQAAGKRSDAVAIYSASKSGLIAELPTAVRAHISLPADRSKLYLSMPESGQVLEVDPRSLKPLRPPLAGSTDLFTVDAAGQFLLAETGQGVHFRSVRRFGLLDMIHDSQLAHNSEFTVPAFSKRGDYCSRCENKEAKLSIFDLSSRRTTCTAYLPDFREHQWSAVADDGRWVAAASGNRITIFGTYHREECRRIAPHSRSILSFAFSARQRRLACLATDERVGQWHELTLWNPQRPFEFKPTAQVDRVLPPVRNLETPPLAICDANGQVASPSGSTGDIAIISLWDAGPTASDIDHPRKPITSLAYDEQGWLYAGCGDELLILRPGIKGPVFSWKHLSDRFFDHTSRRFLAIAVNKTHVFAADHTGYLFVFRRDGDKLVHESSNRLAKSPLRFVRLTKGGAGAILGDAEGTIFECSVPDLKINKTFEKAHSGGANCADFLGIEMLVTGGRDNWVRFWRMTGTGFERLFSIPLGAAIENVAVDESNKCLYVLVRGECRLRRFDLARIGTTFKEAGLGIPGF